MKLLTHFEKIAKWSGILTRWLALALSLVVIFEVISRYLFNRPTIWAFDTAMMLTSTMFLMGGAFVLMEGKHIRVDILFNAFPLKFRTVIDLVFYLIFFFPYTIVMIVYGWTAFEWSWAAREISNTSQWGEPIYLWKAILPLAFFLLFLQGIAEFIRTLRALFKDEGPQEKKT